MLELEVLIVKFVAVDALAARARVVLVHHSSLHWPN